MIYAFSVYLSYLEPSSFWGQRGTELSYSGILSFPQQLRRWVESSGGKAWRAQSTEVSPHPKFSLATSISDNNAYKLKIPKDF